MSLELHRHCAHGLKLSRGEASLLPSLFLWPGWISRAECLESMMRDVQRLPRFPFLLREFCLVPPSEFGRWECGHVEV